MSAVVLGSGFLVFAVLSISLVSSSRRRRRRRRRRSSTYTSTLLPINANANANSRPSSSSVGSHLPFFFSLGGMVKVVNVSNECGVGKEKQQEDMGKL